ncbi:hypothetical protein [Mycobacteroides abscessus]|uniref:hypothetical protein n=1 Tax=Mycobacteroides abscessus TaxID=36809 RepID=UPI0009A630D2|nr:hypothetical protein [Mycobacteroides abscessus]SLH38345.1 Uncharacterised protein [Mycobacteroides abscessus subsp. massiliense]
MTTQDVHPPMDLTTGDPIPLPEPFTWSADQAAGVPARYWTYVRTGSSPVPDPGDYVDLTARDQRIRQPTMVFRALSPWLLPYRQVPLDIWDDPTQFVVLELSPASTADIPAARWGTEDPHPNEFRLVQAMPASAVFGPNGAIAVAAGARLRTHSARSLHTDDRYAITDEDRAADLPLHEATAETHAAEAVQRSIDAGRRPAYLCWQSWGLLSGGHSSAGHEFVLIAARHLIGTTPAWTEQTYQTGMRRYLRQFGDPFDPSTTMQEQP